MQYVNSYYRSAGKDKHLQSILMIENTNFAPQLSEMLSFQKRMSFFSLAYLFYKKTDSIVIIFLM